MSRTCETKDIQLGWKNPTDHDKIEFQQKKKGEGVSSK